MNKKGSSLVFLVIILAGMISVTLAFISVSQKVASISYGDSLMNTSARSVLSEYDRGLKEDYGLFAFRGQQEDINQQMAGYINYTLDVNRGIALTEISADTSEYSLANIDCFEREVLEFTRYAIARGFINEAVSPSGGGEGRTVDTEESDRCLRNQSVISSLPSGAVSGDGNLLKTVKNMLGNAGDVMKKGAGNYLMNRYIMKKFKDGQDQDLDRETFFKYEVEYILEGELDDNENRRDFRRQLVLLRNAVDFAFIYMDPVKRSELIAAAEALTPGPAGLATQLALGEAWALAEAENDVKLLEHGKKVPIYKTSETWAVDLKSIVKGGSVGYIDTRCETGFTYEGYLQIFLFFMDKTRKYSRMMDLMQINEQGTRDSTFLIREHNSGFRVHSRINGREYSYDQEY
ncbi:MAG: DUF5702 domain-containing protein [Anaerovoracaceae bacterium]